MLATPRCHTFALLMILAACWQATAAETIAWRENIEAAIQEAQQENKLILLHFWDHQCPPCLNLEKNVFHRNDFAQAIKKNYIPVKINVSDTPRLQQQYGIHRWPTDVILNVAQQPMYRDVSKQSPAEFIALLNHFATQVNSGNPSSNDFRIATDNFTKPSTTFTINDERQSAFHLSDSTHPPSSRLGLPTLPAAEENISETNMLSTARIASRSLADTTPSLPTPGTTTFVGTSHTHRVTPAAQQSPRPVPLALEGYCPITLAGSAGRFPQWQQGDLQWGAIHRGQLYLFVGLAEQQEFLRMPDRYSPVLSGRDVVRLLKHGDPTMGKRRHGVTYQNRIYLFTNEYSLQEFRKSPNFYSREALKQTPTLR